MTTFQLVGVVVFLCALGVAYRAKLAAIVKTFSGAMAPSRGVMRVEPSVALTVVDDIVAVTTLRDKLSAEGCKDGVDACTQLLRVIVEHQSPAKGAV